MLNLPLLLAILSLLSPLTALEQRKAQVTIRNNSGQPMYNVSVVHKYSNLYKESYMWPVVWDGELASDIMTVQYHTGFLTSGVDWWALAWVDDDNTPYVMDPLNFRQVADFLEKRSPRALSIATLTAVGLATATGGATVAIAAAVAAAIVTQELTDSLFNTEATVGFKQHMLESEDADALTEIIIGRNYAITLKSNSGISRTKSHALRERVIKPLDMSLENKQLEDAAEKVNKLQNSGAGSKEADEADEAMKVATEAWLDSWDNKRRPNRGGKTKKGKLKTKKKTFF